MSSPSPNLAKLLDEVADILEAKEIEKKDLDLGITETWDEVLLKSRQLLAQEDVSIIAALNQWNASTRYYSCFRFGRRSRLSS